MKKITFVICAASLLVLSCNNDSKDSAAADKPDSTTSASTDKKTEEAPFTPVDSATAMKNWQAYATPGQAHAMLAKANGTWTGTVTMWEHEGATPMTSTSTSVNKMIMGGRYQVSNVTGNMMGQPFEGMSTTGYDNDKKVFVSSWVDNLGTGLIKMEGPWDSTTKTIAFKGKMMDPSSGKEIDYKENFIIVDDNNQVMEMFGPDLKTGKEFKTMEIKFTRKK